MKNILLIITLFISWNAFAEEKVWYCTPDAHIGLAFKKNNGYEKSTFTNIKRITIKQKGDYLIIPNTFGATNYQEGECKRKYPDFMNLIACSDYVDSFSLNLDTGYATSSNVYGWILNEKNPDATDDMVIVAWKCESF